MAREIDKSIIMSSAEKGFFTFPTPERGIKALKVLYEYSQKLKG
jgi:acyl-CoA synthetase (NDP forming)